ncbi:MAG: nickel-dependent hydrogenase large subunit [Gammaproteobacteria bacterium]|nr:nickel-dependent hydrogenase large subunit [Gammaproteobacteria bacterium]
MAASGVEGALLIELRRSGDKVGSVTISSSRPLQLPRLFVGKGAAEVCGMLPLLYSVCGLAQGYAAALAFEQALAIDPSPQTDRLRRSLIAFESIREHLWRIEIDWARALGLEADRLPLSRLLALMARFRATLFGEQDPFFPGASPTHASRSTMLEIVTELESLLAGALFGCSPAVWLQRMDGGGFSGWIEKGQRPAQLLLRQLRHDGEGRLGAAGVEAMGDLDRDLLHLRLTAPDADEFIARPDWLGRVPETTAYSRRMQLPAVAQLTAEHGDGVLPRLFARVVEIALLSSELHSGIADPERSSEETFGRNGLAPGVGLAQVETARGRLVHRVELAGERVGRYQILAPTEWNFHPRGVLARALLGMPAASEAELRRRADLLINAIDPCVGYRVVVN